MGISQPANEDFNTILLRKIIGYALYQAGLITPIPGETCSKCGRPTSASCNICGDGLFCHSCCLTHFHEAHGISS